MPNGTCGGVRGEVGNGFTYSMPINLAFPILPSFVSLTNLCFHY